MRSRLAVLCTACLLIFVAFGETAERSGVGRGSAVRTERASEGVKRFPCPLRKRTISGKSNSPGQGTLHPFCGGIVFL